MPREIVCHRRCRYYSCPSTLSLARSLSLPLSLPPSLPPSPPPSFPPSLPPSLSDARALSLSLTHSLSLSLTLSVAIYLSPPLLSLSLSIARSLSLTLSLPSSVSLSLSCPTCASVFILSYPLVVKYISLSLSPSLSPFHTNTELRDVDEQNPSHVLRDFVSKVLSGQDREGGREGKSEGGGEGHIPVSGKVQRISTAPSVRDRHKTESSLKSTIAQLRATQVLCYVCMHVFHTHILKHSVHRSFASLQPRFITPFTATSDPPYPSSHPPVPLHEQHDLKKLMSRADLLGRSLLH
jgi:hypothetical protein